VAGGGEALGDLVEVDPARIGERQVLSDAAYSRSAALVRPLSSTTICTWLSSSVSASRGASPSSLVGSSSTRVLSAPWWSRSLSLSSMCMVMVFLPHDVGAPRWVTMDPTDVQ
jgi:hypothetical protein